MDQPPRKKIRKKISLANQWVIDNPPIPRLIVISAGLMIVLFLLPSYIRVAFWYGLLANKTLASMLFVFCLLAISLVWSAGQKLDSWGFLFFNLKGTRPLWLDRLMLGFTQVGSFFGALCIIMVFYFTNNHRFSYDLIIGTLSLWVIVELLKFLANRSRPFIRLAQTRIVGFRAIGRSFPSGHTSQSFFLATILAHQFNSVLWIGIPLYAVAILVGITRMYVGAHYPRDVLAGAILGTVWGLLAVMLNG